MVHVQATPIFLLKSNPSSVLDSDRFLPSWIIYRTNHIHYLVFLLSHNRAWVGGWLSVVPSVGFIASIAFTLVKFQKMGINFQVPMFERCFRVSGDLFWSRN